MENLHGVESMHSMASVESMNRLHSMASGESMNRVASVQNTDGVEGVQSNSAEAFAIVRSILDYHLFSISDTSITLATLIVFFLILFLTFWASRLVQRAIRRALVLRGVRDEGTIGISTRLAHYLVMVTGLGIAVTTIGINLAAFFAAGAVFAIAIGFAMQNIAENFVSGLILLVERSIKPGDVLEVEGTVVQVVRMGIRATVARSRDGQELIIPNATLVGSTVINYTFRDSLYRLRAAVGVVYGSDMAVVRRILEETADAFERRDTSVEPVVLLTEFGTSSVDFEVSIWMDDPWTGRQALSRLNEAIWFALKSDGIQIAFPQLDLHLDQPVVEALGSRRSATSGDRS